jgi:hypothetical protein
LAALALIAYESAPQFASLAVHSAFLDPVRLFAPVSIGDRLFELERLPLVVLIVAALMIAVVSLWREHEPHRSLIVAGASATQLFLIFADPAPYAYVYGWAAVPVVVGLLLTEGVLVRDSRPFLATTALALAALLAGLIVGYLVVKGHQPRTGSILRAQMDPPISDDTIRRMKTDRLVVMMISGQGQQSLSNQLAVRSEVCRRIDGRVLSVWAYHPICLRDASYYWYEVKWPGIWKDTVPNDRSAFANVFRKTPPSLFIWSGGKSPRNLNDWASGLITGYRKYPQFALRTRPQ